MKKVLLSFLTLLTLSFSLMAQESPGKRVYRAYFRNALAEWTPDSSFVHFIDSLSLPNVHVGSVRIDGYASPVGSDSFNLWLSSARAKVLKDTLSRRLPGIPMSFAGHCEDWDGLRNYLPYSSLDFSQIDRVSDILDAVPLPGDRKQALRSLDGGKVFRILSKEIYPLLRRADIEVLWSSSDEVPSTNIDTFSQASPGVDSDAQTEQNRSEDRSLSGESLSNDVFTGGGNDSFLTEDEWIHRYIFSLRSNLLVPLTNIGIVVPLGRHLSVGGDWYTPWFWHDWANSWCFEFQAANVELRWWLSPFVYDGWKGNSFTGHSFGLSAFGGHYDFESQYSGFQGEVYGVQVDYSYSFYLKRHLRLDLSFGLGYARLPWRVYDVYVPGGKLLRPVPIEENTRNWFGPTKAAVSLVIPISIKTRNREVSHE